MNNSSRKLINDLRQDFNKSVKKLSKQLNQVREDAFYEGEDSLRDTDLKSAFTRIMIFVTNTYCFQLAHVDPELNDREKTLCLANSSKTMVGTISQLADEAENLYLGSDTKFRALADFLQEKQNEADKNGQHYIDTEDDPEISQEMGNLIQDIIDQTKA